MSKKKGVIKQIEIEVSDKKTDETPQRCLGLGCRKFLPRAKFFCERCRLEKDSSKKGGKIIRVLRD